MKVDLLRLTYEEKLPQCGVLILNGHPEFVTVERPWLNNQNFISCIPEGNYKCRRRKASPGITANIGEAFEVVGVPRRTDILFHVANTEKDLKGCIGVGSKYGSIEGSQGVMQSAAAYVRFMDMLTGVNEFDLGIYRWVQKLPTGTET